MGASIEKTIDEIYEFVESCKTSGWGGTKVSVPKDELYELLQELKDIIPCSFEMHGKFHYLGDDGKEASIPYEEILPVLKESGFDGYLICEYEDEMYCGGTEFTRRQLAMERRILQG